VILTCCPDGAWLFIRIAISIGIAIVIEIIRKTDPDPDADPDSDRTQFAGRVLFSHFEKKWGRGDLILPKPDFEVSFFISPVLFFLHPGFKDGNTNVITTDLKGD
jgi:hypothetical protein